MRESFYTNRTRVRNGKVVAQVQSASGAVVLGENNPSDKNAIIYSGIAGQSVAYASDQEKINPLGDSFFVGNILNMINNEENFSPRHNYIVNRTYDDSTSLTNYRQILDKTSKNIGKNYAWVSGVIPESLTPTPVVGGDFSLFGGTDTATAGSDARISGHINQRLYVDPATENSIEPSIRQYVNDQSLLSKYPTMRITPLTQAQASSSLGVANTPGDIANHNRDVLDGGNLVTTYYNLDYYGVGTNVVRPLRRPMGLLASELYFELNNSNRYDSPDYLVDVYDEGEFEYIGIELSLLPDFPYSSTPNPFPYDTGAANSITNRAFRDDDLITSFVKRGLCPAFSRNSHGNDLSFSSGSRITYNSVGVPYVLNSATPQIARQSTPPFNEYLFNNSVESFGVIEYVKDYFMNRDDINRYNYNNRTGFSSLLAQVIVGSFKEFLTANKPSTANDPTEAQVKDYVQTCSEMGVFKKVSIYFNFKNK